MRFFIPLSAFFIPLLLAAGGARYTGMGNVSTSLNDLWSINSNQAGLAFLKTPVVGINYSNQFFLSPIGTSSVGFALPTKQGTFGLSISQHGYSLYKETAAGIAYARTFGPNISAGIKMDYLQIALGDIYGKKSLFVAEMGMQARITKGLMMGVHLYNPTRAKISDYENERIPTILSLGMHYEFSEKIFVGMQVEKNSYYKADLRTGLEYKIIPEIALRAGFSTYPQITSFGLGIILKKFSLDLSSTYHSVLGFSPQIGMQYELK